MVKSESSNFLKDSGVLPNCFTTESALFIFIQKHFQQKKIFPNAIVIVSDKFCNSLEACPISQRFSGLVLTSIKIFKGFQCLSEY